MLQTSMPRRRAASRSIVLTPIPPDLLDQPEIRRGIDHRSGNRLQHMQQHISVGHLAAECVFFGFADDDDREIQRY
jgi:hypothetical protein